MKNKKRNIKRIPKEYCSKCGNALRLIYVHTHYNTTTGERVFELRGFCNNYDNSWWANFKRGWDFDPYDHTHNMFLGLFDEDELHPELPLYELTD